MERVHLHFLGPSPTTPRGNSFILKMVDPFTKWVEYHHRQRRSQDERLSMNSLLDLVILYKYLQIKGPILVSNC